MRDMSLATATIAIADEAALAKFAERFAALLPPSVFVALSGDLGAGKTTLVKLIAAAEGVDPTEVVSPTFGLIHEHQPMENGEQGDKLGARPRIIHADMYRLAGVEDLAETGWEDAIREPSHVFVEWPERIAPALPGDRIDLTITIESIESRTLTLIGRGQVHAKLVSEIGWT